MTYLLDMNTCIVYLRTPLGQLAHKLLGTPSTEIAVSTVTLVELLRGVHLSANASANLTQVRAFASRFTVLPLDLPAAEVAGRIDAELAQRGERIGPFDTLIAAVALAHDLTLVTHNTREFSRVAGLRLEDWELSP